MNIYLQLNNNTKRVSLYNELSFVTFLYWGLWLWGLTPFSTIFSYIVAVIVIGGGNLSTLRKPPTCRWHWHWQILSHNVVSSTPGLGGIRTHSDTNTTCNIIFQSCTIISCVQPIIRKQDWHTYIFFY